MKKRQEGVWIGYLQMLCNCRHPKPFRLKITHVMTSTAWEGEKRERIDRGWWCKMCNLKLSDERIGQLGLRRIQRRKR